MKNCWNNVTTVGFQWDGMFKPGDLLSSLAHVSPSACLWIGYSGGLDSHVLLHALALLKKQNKFPQKLHALHFNHGWNASAGVWEKHCHAVCQTLDVPYTCQNIVAWPQGGESPEAFAREARYKAFSDYLHAGDYLLTAHHQDDQAETLLLQLFRGAGLRGLAAMPALAHFSQGHHWRPLLLYSRNELLTYANEHQLNWIEDSSNRDEHFDRNYIRHAIMPLLKKRWPNVHKTIARSAQHCSQANSLLDHLAKKDLQSIQAEEPFILSLKKLNGLHEEQLNNLLRYWLQQLNFSLPSQAQLEQIKQSVIKSAIDANPSVAWGDYVIRRYRDNLYALKPITHPLKHQIIPWDFSGPISLINIGTLQAEKKSGAGIHLANLNIEKMSIRFYQKKGERCQPVGRQGSHPLKKLFQEWAVPPWQRERIPLIYYEEQLIAIVDYCVCEEFAAKKNETGYLLKLYK